MFYYLHSISIAGGFHCILTLWVLWCRLPRRRTVRLEMLWDFCLAIKHSLHLLASVVYICLFCVATLSLSSDAQGKKTRNLRTRCTQIRRGPNELWLQLYYELRQLVFSYGNCTQVGADPVLGPRWTVSTCQVSDLDYPWHMYVLLRKKMQSHQDQWCDYNHI